MVPITTPIPVPATSASGACNPSIRRRILALATTALVVAGAGRVEGAGRGYFGYVGELTATYDTNIGRLLEFEVRDVVTVASIEGRLGYRGEKNLVELSYRPLYEFFVDRHELNSFDQFARFGWNRAGARSRTVAGAAWGDSQDPRLALPPGVAPPAGVAPGLSPFLLRRTHAKTVQGEIGTEADFGPRSMIGARAAALELTFDDATLFDSTTLDGGLEYGLRLGERARIILGYRYDRFETTRTPLAPLLGTDVVLTLDGGETGGDYRFAPTLDLQFRVGVVQAREEELEAIEGSDRFVGSVLLRRDRGPDRLVESPSSKIPEALRRGWSAGYVRDYSGGSGLFTMARVDEFAYTYVHTFGASVDLSFRAYHGRSVQIIDPSPGDPLAPRKGASITSDMVMGRYSHRFAEDWAAHTTIEFTDQTGDGVPLAQGTFRDVRFSVGLTFAGERKF